MYTHAHTYNILTDYDHLKLAKICPEDMSAKE